jgi:amino acid transporter
VGDWRAAHRFKNGSGIYLLPASLAPLGRNALIGWSVTIVTALTIAFALASLSRIAEEGIRSYVERAFERLLLGIEVCVRVLMRAFNSRAGSILAAAPLPVAPLE